MRSAQSRAASRELNAALRALDQHDRDQRNMLDGISPAGADMPGEKWVQRIAEELRCSDLSGGLILVQFRSIE